jgi:FlaA1/EpsC-like NDP-sugar epimerase
MTRLNNFSRFQKQIIAILADLFFLPLAFCVAIWLRFDSTDVEIFRPYFFLIVLAPLISIPIFIRLGLYRAVIRFIDHKIIYVVVAGVSLSVAILVGVAGFTNFMAGLSRGVFGIYWIGTIMYVAASRFVARSYVSYLIGNTKGVRVAIYGAGAAGNQLAVALKNSHDYRPVAFIDDNKELHGATIAGIRVYGPNALPDLVADKSIRQVLLALPSLSKQQQRRILDTLEPLKIKTLVTPPIKSLLNGAEQVQNLREIDIEDLLGRDAVDPDHPLMAESIEGKSVMVTGAGGSIGSELCRQILQHRPARLILVEMSEYALYAIEQELRNTLKTMGHEMALLPFLVSVLDSRTCKKILSTFQVQLVFHAAAYKHVPLVEHNPIEGIRNNVFGTLSMARAAIDAGVASFVLVSTDKAVRPTNVMGATKRLAELILQAFSRDQKVTRFSMVRFGNVLGSSGSVVPLFRRQILAGGPITITHPDITRYFMTIPEAAQLVLHAGAMGHGGDVFVLDMGEPVKIVDLAKRMVHLSGREIETDVEIDDGIRIDFIGLRPGEKLYEELLIGDNVEGTDHPLILRAKEKEIPWAQLQDLLTELEKACDSFDQEEVRAILLRAVEEYAPRGGIEDFVWCSQPKLRGEIRRVI